MTTPTGQPTTCRHMTNMDITCKSRKHLHLLQFYVMISPCYELAKGGDDASNVRIPNSGGDSRKIKGVYGYRTEAYQTQGAYSSQDQWDVPCDVRGLAALPRHYKNRQARGEVEETKRIATACTVAPQPTTHLVSRFTAWKLKNLDRWNSHPFAY